MKWKIIADSGCDLRSLDTLPLDTAYLSVPLTIHVGEREFVDDAQLDVNEMMTFMYEYNGKTSSACPSPEDYLKAYQGAENVLVVTITGGLSGSNSSAQVAKKMALEENPNAKIAIFDSLSAGGELVLIVQHMCELIKQGLDFEQVEAQTNAYMQRTGLLFCLENVDNLVKNGRLSKFVGKVVGLLNIRMVGKASDKGTLELLHKARGSKKALSAIWDELRKQGYAGGKVAISHCNNPEIAGQIAGKIHSEFPNADVQAYPTSGLCSFYAEQGGILMGFEKK